MTRARLMGAISRKRNRHVRLARTLPSTPLRRVFCSPEQRSFEMPPAKSRNGRPGSQGSRAILRARPKRGACAEGTRRKPDTDARANRSKGSLRWREIQRERHDRICFSICCVRSDQFRVVMSIGYFSGKEAPVMGAPCSPVPPEAFCLRFLQASKTLVVKISDTSHLEKAGSNPAFDQTCRGVSLARGGVTRVRFLREEEVAAALDETDFASSPACNFFAAIRPQCPSPKFASQISTLPQGRVDSLCRW